VYFGNEKDQPSEEIAEGAIRKQLSTGEKIQLCLLKIDGGTAVPEHAHPEEQAGYILKGRFEAKIGDEKQTLEEGDYFRIPGNVPHSGFVHEDTIFIDIYSPPR